MKSLYSRTATPSKHQKGQCCADTKLTARTGLALRLLRISAGSRGGAHFRVWDFLLQ